MEKNILQRLFGFLWDPSDPGKAHPPSGDDPGDNGRPRLTVIEGGKGKGEWDGNERRKPCAVIGIPYSSDAADDTVEEEEESIMKHIAKYMFVFAAVAAAVFALSACGGGGGSTVQGSSPAVSAGTMAKGSVIVNGVKFTAAAGATIKIDDTAGHLEAELLDGMQVKVKGRINDDRVTGQFEKVEAEPEVRGKIAGAPGADDFTVNGQTVITDDNTVFEDRIGGVIQPNRISINDLRDLNEVEVHGGRDDLGNIRATRVERRDDTPPDEVKGTISDVPNGTTFTLSSGNPPVSITVNYATATVRPAGVLSQGKFVEVHGTFAAGTLTATFVDLEDQEDVEFEPAQGQEFEVEGFIGGYLGTPGVKPNLPVQFGVAGTTVKVTSTTLFKGGSILDLDNNVKVEAEGHFDNVLKVLTADKIQFKHTRVILEGSTSGVTATSFTLLGKTVKITSVTQGSVTARVQVRGFEDGGGNIVAERIEDKPAGGNPRDIVQSRVTATNGTNSLTLLGVAFTASVSPAAVYRDVNDNPILAGPFFAAVVPKSATNPGTLVKLRVTPTTTSYVQAELQDED